MIINENFFSLNQPYMHLIIGESADFDNYMACYLKNKKQDVIIRIIEGIKCHAIDKLFNEFCTKLEFPDYFGENWAAFDECINDLEWLFAKGYILFITDMHEVLRADNDNFEAFIATLCNAVQEWTQGRNYDNFPTNPTPFHIIFHCVSKEESLVMTRLKRAGLSNIDRSIITS